MKIRKTLYVILICLILFLGGCDSDKIFTQEDAEKIVLKDAPKFKPDNTKFEVWATQETDSGWIVMISSKQPTSEKPFPNIVYEISEDGKIL